MKPVTSQHTNTLLRQNLSIFKKLHPPLGKESLETLRHLTIQHRLSVSQGELLWVQNRWYVTHSGLLSIAHRSRCAGIITHVEASLSDPSAKRWVVKAIVFKRRHSKSFVGYGDADPSNTSDLVRGAEMRVAETRAVNRALRKAYGIGICSVEEIGSFSLPRDAGLNHRKRPPQPANRNGANGQHLLRDRLCQLIRQHQLDPVLVKSYFVNYCGVKALKDASREQVEGFIDHVADWAGKDKNALVCQLNSYLGKKEGVA
jgi:hypothetical protein